MINRLLKTSFYERANKVEWKLLLFLILFMNVKLWVKFCALILIYILQPGFRFGFRFTNSRLPLFYLVVIGIAVFNYFIYRDFSASYTVTVITAIGFWVACVLALHQVKLFSEKTHVSILHNTLTLFFILNIIISLFNLTSIFQEIGFRNPFHYQGEYQKYFINTGDHIKGLSFDSSTTNAIINCFGIAYFLTKEQYRLTIACMIALLLTASNFSNVILMLVFILLFFLKTNKAQKSAMIVCTLLLVIFLVKFSPQNENYMGSYLNKYLIKKEKEKLAEKIIPIRERPDSLLNEETKKEKIATLYLDSLEREEIGKIFRNNIGIKMGSVIGTKERPVLPGDSIHTAAFQWKRDTTPTQRQILAFAEKEEIPVDIIKEKYNNGLPGKILAIQESVFFFKEHPLKIFTGNGSGNFSSKLAFRTTGLNIAGGYPQQCLYSHKDYLENHFSLYTYFFTKNASSHSLVNSPASVYDQLFTEYGLAGLAVLLFLYLGFFLKQYSKLSYGIPLLAIMLAAFAMDYWFEQLSIVVLFELMMFTDIKEHTKAMI